jgi:hypothetical protein
VFTNLLTVTKNVQLRIDFFNLMKFIDCKTTVVDCPNNQRMRFFEGRTKFEVHSEPSLRAYFCFEAMRVQEIVFELAQSNTFAADWIHVTRRNIKEFVKRIRFCQTLVFDWIAINRIPI